MTTFIFDLDGVLYRGERTVPGAGEALTSIAAAGHRVLFATNDSHRVRSGIAEKIERRTGFPVEPEQIVTSAMAAAELATSLGVCRPLIVGGPGIFEAIAAIGGTGQVEVEGADSVIVGLDYDITYESIHRAMTVARDGRPFIATNRDATFPADGSLKPGAGSIVAAVAEAAGLTPMTAGKPAAPMIDVLGRMVGPGAVVIVGDRPETDLAMGKKAGWITVGVGTGVIAGPDEIPANLQPDLYLESVAELPQAALAKGWLQDMLDFDPNAPQTESAE